MSESTARPSRRHDIDALRVLAFGLLILYHVGMFYVSWDWHVKSPYPATWLEPVMLLVNQWRMPLIFLISGLAVTFLLGEGDTRRMSYAAFAGQRIRRLLVPLVFGMAVVVPPQAYVEALARGAIEPGYAEFLWRYFTFAGWPEGAFAGADIGITWNHLWYLAYLLVYTLALIPLAAWLNGPGAFLRRGFRALRGLWLVLLPLAPLMAAGLLVFPRFPYISHDLVTDFYAHAMFGTFFVYGFLLGRDAGLWAELARLRWWTLGTAVCAYAAFMGARALFEGDPAASDNAGFMFVIYLNRWCWLLAVLGWGHRWLNRPFRWLPYANGAVYPWYVLHQTLIVVAGYVLARRALGPLGEPAALVAVTVGGCALIHHLLLRRAPRLGALFGAKATIAARRESRPAAAGAAGP